MNESSSESTAEHSLAQEFTRFVSAQRRAKKFPAAPKPMAPGTAAKAVVIDSKSAAVLLRVAAKRASGLVRPTQRQEVVWVHGDSELAIQLSELQIKLADGLITVLIPVRCDQTGSALVEVVFVVGSKAAPAGLYASAHRRPNGHPLIVEAWAEALTAFAWQCVLGLVSGVAGAIGKDDRGNVLVPVEMTAARSGLQIVPMARHHFAGSSGLKTKPSTNVKR